MNPHRHLLISLLAAGATAVAGTSSTARSTSAAESETARDPIAALHWLSGHWCMQRADELIEELWLAPSGGLLIGMGRTVKQGEARAFEYLRIERRQGAVTFLAQPNGTPPTPFRLTASGTDWARFENPIHDFPRRVEYRRTANGLSARISGPGGFGADGQGAETSIDFDYLPCPD
jgi:hypothetical protein